MKTIAGKLDYRLLAEHHRPTDPEALRGEAIRLTADGLSVRDVGQALGISALAVERLLRERAA